MKLFDIVAAVAFTSALLAIFFYLPWRIRHSYRQTFIAIARAVEAREPHLLGHAEKTARYVVLMARWRGMGFARTRTLEYAALLHGIGKVSVPYGLLNSPACPPGPADRFVLRDYVRVGAAILDAIPVLSPAADAVRYHHEYLDGSGYPFGRHGKDIPADAQMLCIASEYVAMTTPRLYRAGLAMTTVEADAHVRAQVGTRYSRGAAILFRCARVTERLCLVLRSAGRFALRIVSNQPGLPRLPRRVL